VAGSCCAGLRPTNTSPTQGLQEAINAASPGATITLCAGTWQLTSTVVIAKNLTLVGAGAGRTVLDGGRSPSGPGGVRVLEISGGVTVTLRDLAITKGNATGASFPIGGGILTFPGSTLTLVGVSVTGNTAPTGGGLFNIGGTVTLGAGTTVSGNEAPSGGDGGGLFNQLGTMTLQAGSSVTGNSAGERGGGILAKGGTLTLQAGSSVTGNQANPLNPNSGGGIYVGGGTVNLEPGSVVTGNTPDNCSQTIGTCT
jgi:fibronectin-binding autotransporter adhesin